MKKIFLIFVLLCLFISPTFAKRTGTITVEVSGLKKAAGFLPIGLYNKAKDFPIDGREFKGVDVKVTDKTVLYTFKDVPDGEYAIAVFHDANSNHKHDMTFFGKVSEGYGFSNNAPVDFGPPPFKKAQFQLKGHADVKIKLRYGF